MENTNKVVKPAPKATKSSKSVNLDKVLPNKAKASVGSKYQEHIRAAFKKKLGK